MNEAGREDGKIENQGENKLGENSASHLEASASAAAQPEAAPVHGGTGGRGWVRSSVSKSWVSDLLLALVVVAFIFIFLYQPVRVEGTSMNPGLADQDRLIINKVGLDLGTIHRGDVVVFRYPRDTAKSYIKRVIALPGDTLRIDRGRVYVDGKLLQEPYVPLRFTDDRSEPELTLGPDEYYVMGDHRVISSDSRDFGPVDRKLIYGRAAFVYWPMEQARVVH